jgi:patatin-like phospholipase/acyl hydrolase
LGDEILFGGQHDNNSSYITKVAVTSTSRTADEALVIANYNRQEDREPTYRLEFSADPAQSMTFWEAAAATSAAPSFFKPFLCTTNKGCYIDGALYHNNPVNVANHERRLLWPDIIAKHPDIFLSIGTGQNELKMRKDLDRAANGLTSQRGRNLEDADSAKLRKESRASKSLCQFFGVLVS